MLVGLPEEDETSRLGWAGLAQGQEAAPEDFKLQEDTRADHCRPGPRSGEVPSHQLGIRPPGLDFLLLLSQEGSPAGLCPESSLESEPRELLV